MGKNKVLILAGPTGVGKSDLSIKLAQSLNGEIISADSMQVYKYMDIGSAKIKKQDMKGIEHHLIDVCNPDDSFNVSIYADLAKNAIEKIISRNKLPMIVGGTGLYIRSTIFNQSHCESGEDLEYRKYLYELSKSKGNIYVHQLLKEIDMESYENIHYNNLKRVIRALEVYHLTKKPFSSFKQILESNYDFKYYVLNREREILYDNINKRVNVMIESGLIDEVINLKNMGYSKDLQSMQGIGYKEVFEYLDGIVSLDDAIEKIKQNSRNYAKRQLTWFKKEKNNHFIEKDSMSELEIEKYIIEDFNRS